MRNLIQIGDDACGGLGPIVSVVKNGIIPIFKIIVPIALILWGTIDLGKAVISSSEDEIKKAQKLLIKRFIYAALVFFVVVIVEVLMNIIAKGEVDGTTSWQSCWRSI